VLGAVVAVALVVAGVLGGFGGPDEQTPGSPEATVQQYFEALLAVPIGDVRATYSLRLAEQCTDVRDFGFTRPSRVVLAGSHPEGERTAVDVRITLPGDTGIFGGAETTIAETVLLVRTDTGWGIDEVPWPYFCDFVKGSPS